MTAPGKHEHRYREAVVNATLAALSDGDVEALAGLAAPGCEGAARKDFAAVATKAKGQKVDATSIKLEAVPKRYSEAALTGCAPVIAKTILSLYQ